jgi:hypothetical protein
MVKREVEVEVEENKIPGAVKRFSYLCALCVLCG